MINIFHILRDVLQTKSGTLNEKPDFKATFSPFLIQRWLSMESKTNAYLLNETTNKLWSGLEDDKQLWYKLYLVLINKKAYNKINYIKKSEKIVNEKREKEVEELAKRNRISKREIEEYLELETILQHKTTLKGKEDDRNK
jgi:hypothetical protein